MNHRPTQYDLQDYETKGFFYLRGLLTAEDVEALKSEVARVLEKAIADGESVNADNNRADSRKVAGIDMFRKIGFIEKQSQTVWERLVCNETVQELNRHFLGDNVRCRGVFVFTKPARTGESTPWHQDIGLWAQKPEQKSFLSNFKPTTNMWIALDAATKANGCLHVAPGSHQGEVIEHIKYDDAVHVELPRELTDGIEVEHAELAPGDALFWHSHLWHYSPRNESGHNRWGMGMIALDDEN